MTYPSNYELVRKDLLRREQADLDRFGAPRSEYTGSASIFDAYDKALSLVCYLRQVIEEMKVGVVFHNPVHNDPPGYAQ